MFQRKNPWDIEGEKLIKREKEKIYFHATF